MSLRAKRGNLALFKKEYKTKNGKGWILYNK